VAVSLRDAARLAVATVLLCLQIGAVGCRHSGPDANDDPTTLHLGGAKNGWELVSFRMGEGGLRLGAATPFEVRLRNGSAESRVLASRSEYWWQLATPEGGQYAGQSWPAYPECGPHAFAPQAARVVLRPGQDAILRALVDLPSSPTDLGTKRTLHGGEVVSLRLGTYFSWAIHGACPARSDSVLVRIDGLSVAAPDTPLADRRQPRTPQ
jgi:hypothetical protein